ncbi:MAG: NADPH-dependent F420 reductase [Armatimonadetes bacterium]|nr:NADPH-dependent F420 reductase [Armatimonadota bacterium]MDW8027143.1 NADPH-dependent F420 reductase [Armatimonadota bacterium]
MRIGILGGTGRMGRGLAKAWAKKGHEIFLGSRFPDKVQQVAQQIANETGGKVYGVDLETAADEGEVVVLSLPYRTCSDWLKRLGNKLRGKIIIDITNPFGAVPEGQTSGVEENAKALEIPARWVAAFKTNFWTTLDSPVNKDGITRDCFFCGDDNEAKKVVAELISQVGFRPVDCGPLKAARILDLMVPLMIDLDRFFGGKGVCSWKLLD